MGDLYNPFPKLPKNVRQIGEPDQVLRFYVEDYVNTYLKRLYPSGKQTLRVGVLLGSVEQYDGTPYIFVDGAMELEDVETDGGTLLLSESVWKKAYQVMETAFPKRTVQGWFLCGGPASQLSPLNYWKQHSQYFAGKNQLMYLNHGLEGEEAVYVTSEDGFYRLKGYYVYYERNQMMQDYMITRKDVRRVESGSHEKVIKDFRQRMTAKKEAADSRRHMANALGMVCGLLSVAVLAGGVALVNNYQKMRRMESVLASVLPAGVGTWEEYQEYEAMEEPEFVIEEAPGNVYPTESQEKITGETGESYRADSLVEETPESGSEKLPDSAGKAETPTTEQETQSLPIEEETAAPLVGMGKEEGQGDTPEESSLPIDYETAMANGYTVYQVGEGETLYGICWKKYGNLSRLSEVCSLNQLENVDHILAGQRLILP